MRIAFVKGVVVAFVAGFCVLATPLSGQISFTWPSKPPEVSTYGVVETCLAYYKNIFERTHRQRSTVEQKNAELTARVRDCASPLMMAALVERKHVTTVFNAYWVLLAAGRDADARTVANAWLSSLGEGDDSLRTYSMREIFRASMTGVKPARWNAAWDLVGLLDRHTQWRERFYFAGYLMLYAYGQADSVQLLNAAQWVVDETRQLGPDVTSSAPWPRDGARTLFSAQKHLKERESLNHLRRSTAAYYAFLNALQDSSKAGRGEGKIQGIPSAPVQGDDWFPSKPPAGRPARGAVSVVIDTDDNECMGCEKWVTVVKQLHQRFPNVEFTIVTQTRGFFGLVMEPPSPDIEAQLIDSVYRKVHRVPATVVVHRTKFWRLDEGDNRRVNIAGPNPLYHSSSRACGMLAVASCAHIIDRDGVIIESLELGKLRMSDRRMALLLDALVHQL